MNGSALPSVRGVDPAVSVRPHPPRRWHRRPGSGADDPKPASPDSSGGARHRSLLAGARAARVRIGSWATADWFLPRSPNLFWPDDRRWCIATEIDFDSTLLGGPTDLINDVLRREDLEAWPVGPLDSLAWDGDTINQADQQTT